MGNLSIQIDETMSEQQLQEELARSQKQIQVLHQRLMQLEQSNNGGGRVPETMLLSDSFLKRAFAVFGHSMVASLIVMVPFYLIVFLMMMAVGFSM